MPFLTRSRLPAVPLLLLPAACAGSQDPVGAWPPPDFELDVQYAVQGDGRPQLRQKAQIYADGVVVYRESDEVLHSADGKLDLPVWHRVCAYKLHWRSIRHLSRALHRAPVLEVKPETAPATGERAELITFHLEYHGNRVDLLLRDRVIGLSNRVLRIVNAFLPEDHTFAMQQMAGEPLVHRVLDVPEVRDSIEGALGFHREWLRQHPDNPFILQDTFALACKAKEWGLAEDILVRLERLHSADVASFRQVLTASRAAAGG